MISRDDKELLDRIRRLAVHKSAHVIAHDAVVSLTVARRIKKPGFYPSRMTTDVREKLIRYETRFKIEGKNTKGHEETGTTQDKMALRIIHEIATDPEESAEKRVKRIGELVALLLGGR